MKEFKNLTVYQLQRKGLQDIDLTQVPDAAAFVPCGPTCAVSIGFVPPRGEQHGALCEASGGHHIYKLLREVRAVPGQAVQQHVADLAEQVERDTGRKPGRKHLRELREQAILELMPTVIPRQSATLVWIDLKHARLIIGTGSAARADETVSELIKALPGLVISHIETKHSPANVMGRWLLGLTDSEWFDIGRDLVLVSHDEMRSSVRYDKHALDLDEIRAHISAGKLPQRLALTYLNRVSFVLTDAMQIKKLNLLDLVFEGKQNDNAADEFDAHMAIFTGEVRRLLNNLITSLN